MKDTTQPGPSILVSAPESREVHTPADLAALSLHEKLKMAKALLVGKANKHTTFHPLSYSQQALWFLYCNSPAGVSYNEGVAVRIPQALDPEALRRAAQKLVNRHAALRTTYQSREGVPVQQVHGYQDAGFTVREAGALREPELVALVKQDHHTPFRLETGPVFRVFLYRAAPADHVLLLSIHHIACDGSSMAILLDELLACYQGETTGPKTVLPPLQRGYVDFVEAQHQHLSGPAGETLRQYWGTQLGGDLPLLDVTPDKPRPRIHSDQGGTCSLPLDPALTGSLKSLSKGEGTTLFVTLLSAFQVLLHRHSGQDDLVVGTPATTRTHAGFEQAVGYFVNPVAIRSSTQGEPTGKQFLARTRRTVLDALEHQDYPFPLLVEQLGLSGDLSRTPVFQAFFYLQTAGQYADYTGLLVPGAPGPVVHAGGVPLAYFEFESKEGRFDISLEMVEHAGRLTGIFRYNADIFLPDTIARLAGHYETLLRGLVADPGQAVDRLPLLTDREREQLLHLGRGPAVAFPQHEPFQALFEAQVQRTPDAVALQHEGVCLTYAALNGRANQLAHCLRDTYAVRPNELVGLLTDRSPWMVIGMLAVFKAGGAYFPIHPDLPAVRVENLLAQTRTRLVLTDRPGIPAAGPQWLALPDAWETLSRGPVHNPAGANQSADLAYVIFTSGSTGQPKGAMIEHQGMVNHLYAKINHLGLHPGSTVAQNASQSFDISVWQTLAALLCGGKTIIYGNDVVLDPDAFLRRTSDDGVTVLEVVPAYLGTLLDRIAERGGAAPYSTLEYLLVTGELLPHNLVKRWFGQFPGIRLVNAYGPTEASDDITHHFMDDTPEGPEVPIGRTVQNLSIYILDRHRNLCPPGVKGELCVAGVGVGRGYLGDEARTAEAFGQDPFAGRPARLYRTGDLARMLPDGTLLFYGRRDFQVKVRGHRIELGEIEQTLVRIPGVRNAAVLCQPGPDGDGHLTGWVVTEPACVLTGEQIREAARGLLPEYMVPGELYVRDSFPLTAHGKLDRKALALLSNPAGPAARGYVPPRNHTEAQLVRIWQDLLNRPRIGITDRFFELGGHSLKAIRLQARIQKHLHASLSLKDLFFNATIESLAQLIRSAAGPAAGAIERVAEAEWYPVSPAQRRLWILDQLEGIGAAYNMPGAFLLTGPLDREAFAKAFRAITDRHEALRTVFPAVDGEPVQRVVPADAFAFELTYARHTGPESEVAELAHAEAGHRFDLARGPLLRAGLVELGPDRYLFLFTVHHIICDGWSLEVLVRELILHYNAYARGASPRVAPLPIQQKDYAAWQHRQLDPANPVLRKQQAYWLGQFAGEAPILQLPTDFPRPTVKTYRGGSVVRELDPAALEGLRDWSGRHGCSVFMTLLTSVLVLLNRYTGQRDLVVGTTIAGREHPDLEDQIGLFVNTLALRTHLDETETFAACAEGVKRVLLDAYEHQHYPFDRLVGELPLTRDPGRSPLFDVSVEMIGADINAENAIFLEGVDIERCTPRYTTAKFDLSFRFLEEGKAVRLQLEYNQDLFAPWRIEALMDHYCTLAAAIPGGAQGPVAKLQMLPAAEQDRLLRGFNPPPAPAGRAGTFLAGFRAQAAGSPGAVALDCAGKVLTYGQLDEVSDRLAHHLVSVRGVRPGQLVALLLERSERTVIGMLGVMKAGGAFLPIDAAYPPERTAFLLADSGVQLLLTDSCHLPGLPAAYGHDVVALDAQLPQLAPAPGGPACAGSPADLAYVIYTSGSTGTPKGARIGHDNLANYLAWANAYYFGGAAGYHTAFFSSLSFDFTLTGILTTLLRGDTLYVCPNREIDVLLREMIDHPRINWLKLTPAHLNALAFLAPRNPRLSVVIVGGEELTGKQVGILRSINPGVIIYNEYGPTETTVGCTVKRIAPGDPAAAITIGKPIANTHIHIVDRHLNLLPVGVPGEIAVAGAGVGRGYLNEAGPGNARFIAGWPHDAFGGRLYLTGDTGCRLPDGEIAFLGRRDHQVKIRGYRVEPAEVEHALLACPGVSQAVVQVWQPEGQAPALVAYVGGTGPVPPAEVRKFLAARLPGYMVPAYFVPLEAFPLTGNGKVDRKALPPPGAQDLGGAGHYAPPRHAFDAALAALWERVLERRPIGIRDNFFELGGHSLKAMQIVSAVYKELNVKLELRDLFARPTIEGLGDLVHGAPSPRFEGIGAAPAAADYPVSFAQRRLWINQQVDGDFTAFNMSKAFRPAGTPDAAAFRAALSDLMQQHESLRTTFRAVEGEPRQVIRPFEPSAVPFVQLSLAGESPWEEAAARLCRQKAGEVFDLAEGPLWRVYLIGGPADQWVALFCIHHILCDDWSGEQFLSQFSARYRHHRRVAAPALPPLPIQYKDYVVWQRRELSEHRFDAHRAYWTTVLAGEIPVLELPLDFPRPARKTHRGDTRRVALDGTLCQGLQQAGVRAGASTFMTFLATVKALLYRYTGQTDLVVGTPVADREHADLAEQIGFYTNTLALRSQVQPGESFDALLAQVKSRTLEAYAHQSYPLDQLFDDLALRHDPSRSPLFDVVVLLQYRGNDLDLGPADGGHAEDFPLPQTTSLVDLRFIFVETADGWALELEYDTSLFTAARIGRMLGHYQELVAALLRRTDCPLGRLAYLPESEQNLLASFNDTYTPRPEGLTMVHLLAAQVERTPGHVALECNGHQLTYRELQVQSDRLAGHLREEMALVPGQCVGLMAEKSERTFVAFWAILKAGGVYLPIDPALPAARRQYLLEDAGVAVLLTESDYLFDLEGYEGALFALDVQLDTLPEATGRPYACRPSDAAYLIYTSGSTGTPKGVLVEHGSNVNMALSQVDTFGVEATDRVWQFAPLNFDASISEISMAHYTGATLVIPAGTAGREALDTLADTLREARVGVVTLPPALLQVMDVSRLAFLKVLISAGEAAPAALARAGRFVGRCFNAYGPTEYAVCASIYRVTPGDEEKRNIPIGRAIANTELLVLDGQLQRVPVGVPGELCIAGAGLARGYLGQEALTQDKFIVHPFRAGERLYRTGDLARWREDGQLEYLGRLDGQVKIRGMRTELGEIENHLLGQPHVQQAAVLLTGEQLTAYLVVDPSAGDGLSAAELRNRLAAHLPEYMVPAAYRLVDRLPLTASGKLDRKALAAAHGQPLDEQQAAYVAPATGLEAQLASVWQEVLGRERVGVEDNFFQLGGHSLKAIQAITHFYKLSGVKLELRTFFAHPTVRALAGLSLAAAEETLPPSAIARQPEQAYYPISHAQKRLWILDQMQQDTPQGRVSYNVPSALLLEGPLNRQALQAALLGLLARHESLRTAFSVQQGEPCQQVVPPQALDFRLHYQDLRGAQDAPAEARQRVSRQAHEPFDLERAPLLRAGLLQVEEQKHVFWLNLHHIICDGWSMEVLTRELALRYNAFCRGEDQGLAPLAIQYRDYAVWQQQQLADGGQLSRHRRYWLGQLAGELPVLELPTDFPRPAARTYQAGSVSIFLGGAVREGLVALGNEHGGSTFSVLLAAVQTLLYRYTAQTDLVVGIPAAGRGNADLEEQVGFYVNMLPIRSRLDGNEGFGRLLSGVVATVLDAYAHEMYPFDCMVDALNLTREAGRSPLFDVSVEFVTPDEELTQALALDQLRARPCEVTFVPGKYDLTFKFTPADGGVGVELLYDTDLFDPARAARMAGHLGTLIRSVLADPQAPLSRLDWLTAEEVRLVTDGFNDTRTPYEDAATLHELFERQAARTPDAVAVQFGDRTLTYGQLNAQANQLAGYLRNTYCVQPNDLVGVLMRPSEKRVVALLGILKAGGAYVPIDPDYPADRIRYTLSDAAAKVLLTDAKEQPAGEGPDGPAHFPTGDWHCLSSLPAGNLSPLSGPRDLVYVIYTSGSTGRPKGVMLEHTSVVNRIEWMWKQYGFTSEDVILQKTPYGFDVSVWEFFMTLCYGARLVVCETEVACTPARLLDCIARHGVSTLHFVPSMFTQFLEGIRGEDRRQLKPLRRIFASGEALPAGTVRLNHQLTGVPVYNLYGPTEAAVDVSHYTTRPEDPLVPIGRAIANTELLVLDGQLQRVPVGVPGELCIAGAGLARGYLGQEALTGEKFIGHPFRAGERLYRTGDLARWREDGQLEYLGRLDGQVKIRGMRTELGEIENHLLGQPHVQQAAVQLTGEQLTAYLVVDPSAGDGLSAAELRNRLAAHLPEYMVPAAYRLVDRLPLTASGKLDRKALAAAHGQPLEDRRSYLAPATGLEAQLASVWQEVLGRERVGREDNFFQLGGHSLKAIQVIARFYKLSGRHLALRAFFAHPTLAALAGHVEEPAGPPPAAVAGIARQPEQAYYPISHAQKRLWILDQMQQDTPQGRVSYNVPSALLLEGPLNRQALQAALLGLLARHESLRTAFSVQQGEPCQQVVPPQALDFRLHYQDLRGAQDPPAEARRLVSRQAHEPFDLERAPLLRAGLLQVEEQKHVFWLNLHHIICDGWSMEVLTRELALRYNAFCRGEDQGPAPLAIQYRDYAVWQQQQLAEGGQLSRHRRYWLGQLAGELPVLELPTDFPRPAVKTYASHALDFQLDEALSRAFRQVSEAANTSLFATLFTAVAVLMNRYSRQDDLVLGTAVAGRGHHDLHDQIGFYLSTLALRLDFGGPDDFARLLAQTQQTLLSAFEHQAYPFEQLVEDLNVNRDTSRSPLFDVLVVSQDFGLAHEALPGTSAFDGLTSREYGVEFSGNKYDLTFYVGEEAGRVQVRIAYNTGLFRPERIERMFGHFVELSRQALARPDASVYAHPCLSGAEYQELVCRFNDTRTPYSEHQTLHGLFERQADKTPQAAALRQGDRTLSYAELDRRANRLARYLAATGVGPGDPVGLVTDRSFDMVTGMLGILKAGGAYVPIDPEYPLSRKEYILENAGIARVITNDPRVQAELAAGYGAGGANRCLRFGADEPLPAGYPDARPGLQTPGSQLAYIIYTSGSTGRPKGVMIEHHSAVNLVEWVNHTHAVGADDRLLFVTSMCFDLSVYDLFGMLACGGCVVMARQEQVQNPDELGRMLRDEAITFWDSVPSTMDHLVSALEQSAGPFAQTALRLVFMSGDWIPVQLPDRLKKYFPNARVVSLGGATEGTVWSNCYPVETVAPGWKSIPYGKPIANNTFYILDKGRNPVPQGVIGELYIGGVGVARGYQQEEEKTRYAFVDDPFADAPGRKMYRTGDLGRMLPDGNMEFLGRKDNQVKVRGYRVELGEIEKTLLGLEGVQQAAVTAFRDPAGVNSLAAYLVADRRLAAAELTAHLRQSLPAYMLPGCYIQMDAFPLNANGKVDRRAFPDPQAQTPAHACAAPRNELEGQVLTIWKRVLRKEEIGINDNFFMIGGHSLLATRVIAHVHEELGVRIGLTNLFNYPTIEGLSLEIGAAQWAGQSAGRDASKPEDNEVLI